MPESTDRTHNCWPWEHDWTLWQVIESGKLTSHFMISLTVVGRYETQRRKCKRCGKSQLRETRA